MYTYCRYSGIEFKVEFFPTFTDATGKKIKPICAHPIMEVPVKELIPHLVNWAAGRLSKVESRLLFISFLKSTELVKWECAAFPSDATVFKHMQELARFAGFKDSVRSPQLVFNKVTVNPLTKDLRNLGQWLETWKQKEEDWKTGFISSNLKAKLASREEVLERLIKSNLLRNETNYITRLAEWAMEASSAPVSLREYWTELFHLKGLEIFKASHNDLDELVEHMERFLDHGTIYAATVLKHVRSILARNRQGLNYGLGIPDEQLANIDFDAAMRNPFRIVEDDIETANREILISEAPAEKPVEKNFPNKVAYLRAKFAFDAAVKDKTEKEEIAKKMEAFLKQQEAVEQKKIEKLETALSGDDGNVEEDEDMDSLISQIRSGTHE